MKKNILNLYLLFTVGIAFTSCSKEDNPIAGARICLDELTDLPNNLFIGNEIKLKSTVTTDEGTEKTITWTSYNPAVASVTNGKLTALKEGITTITAQTGKQTEIYIVTVRDLLTYDEGVVINGLKWATRNVDAPGTFAAKPEDAGMFYQWNRNVGWSATYPRVNSNGGTTWDSSTPSNVPWEVANDPCPIGWRIPFMGAYGMNEEFFTLFDTDYVSNVWSSANGMTGRKFTDRASGNSIFLPAACIRSNYWNSQFDIISGLGEDNGGLTFTGFQWYKAGEVIDEATGPYYQVKDNAVYLCELTTSNNDKMRTINILPQSLHK